MFSLIQKEPELKKIIRQNCEDEGMCINFESNVNPKDYIVMKVDDYYNSLNIEKRPPSPDCLIIQKCKDNGYLASIVELKGISSSGDFEINNIVDKFNTCLNDFMSYRFKKVFLRDYKNIKLYFISNIDIYKKRDLGLKMEVLIEKRFLFNSKKYMIDVKNKTIKQCY